MSPEEFADLEKELYLNAIEEQKKVRELAVPYINVGHDGAAAYIKANLDYHEKYPEQFAYDVELHARVAAERGRQAAVIAEAQENQNKFYSKFDSKFDENKEKEYV